jgi:SAM-dependent methyltransferase
MNKAFESLIAEAEQAPLEGWDFTHLAGRMVEAPLAFAYVAQVRRRLPGVAAMLDLGTGGGEVLAQIAPLPGTTIATEAYSPNAPVAARRLGPLGASVVLVDGAPENWSTAPSPARCEPALPLRSQAFDLVIDRHESYLAAEVFRVLRPGGRFLTQQCGGRHHTELNDRLGIPRPPYAAWRLEMAKAQLRAVGFEGISGQEQFTFTRFHDVGAIVACLRAMPWQAPDFIAAEHLEALWSMHREIVESGPVVVRAHHFLVEASRPKRYRRAPSNGRRRRPAHDRV